MEPQLESQIALVTEQSDAVRIDLTSDDVDGNNTQVAGDLKDPKDEGDEKDPKAEGDENGETASARKKRKSKVWNDFTMVKVKGVDKAECNHCKFKLSMGSGTTTHLHRHISNCLARKLGDKRQKYLAADPTSLEGACGNLITYQYDKDKVRDIMSKMFLVHEYPFRMAEHAFFNMLLKSLNPRFEKISRVTMKSDCMKIFSREKTRIKQMLAGVSRVSLTSDLWTSNQTIGYMCLTGHFLDADWKLQKRILNFCGLPPPHTGVAIADTIFKCLHDWGIENKICTITLDNASANDAAVRNLKDNFALKGRLLLKGKIFHVRCSAHVLNLMVQDGLTEIQKIILNIRESVKYFKMSPSRLHKFVEIVKQLQLPTSKRLILDVPTRWNSTYAMLEAALVFKEVFPRYQERDPYYQWLPSVDDWKKAEKVCQFLEVFNEATNIFSGSDYPTANLILPEIWKIKQILNDASVDDCDYMREMSLKMSAKFDKYWGDCNLLIAIAVVLDPRYKMKFIEFCFPKIYLGYEAERHIKVVRESLYQLFEEYVAVYSSKDGEVCTSSVVAVTDKKCITKSRVEFDLWAQQMDTIEPLKSDLDVYLEEGRYTNESDVEFNILNWWKTSTAKFRVLSKMAGDILSIPISTVASESAFSAGGRVLDQYRSSLRPNTVEALICTGDWLRCEYGVSTSVKGDEDSMEEICLE
ncbi:zinc finger BED domain-containing protein RICESLEEPER 2-like [Rosa rugosa]|uniref:zinc finger BED domain-containing protein RICESLEEPER 2-like n=1 Tax=Rosa rugosa TaxID=74645 RepID=UPI002B40CC0D|nr:zinc finger BED domain-containing protein RICESLEEPER 2-like [Rosa rugosa]XP_062005676.1 zinc finger BED domain-containing protein RICESLEEPER 2-like [Rosa rugosa]